MPYDLYTAVQRRNATSVRNRLAAGESPNVTRGGYSALLCAIGNLDFDCAWYLLQAGANPDLGFADLTPLTLAVKNDDVNLAELLLAHGATIGHVDRDGRRAIDYIDPAGRCTRLKAQLVS